MAIGVMLKHYFSFWGLKKPPRFLENSPRKKDAIIVQKLKTILNSILKNTHNMHKEVLTKEQMKLLPLIKKFSKNFGLVGGTAVAFYVGHRESIDFDLFSLEEFSNFRL